MQGTNIPGATVHSGKRPEHRPEDHDRDDRRPEHDRDRDQDRGCWDRYQDRDRDRWDRDFGRQHRPYGCERENFGFRGRGLSEYIRDYNHNGRIDGMDIRIAEEKRSIFERREHHPGPHRPPHPHHPRNPREYY